MQTPTRDDGHTDISILICTRNRATCIQDTLNAIAQARVPDGLRAELLVVDNGSIDGTAEVLRAARFHGAPVRAVAEPRPGVSHARNAALSSARGEVFLWTDDDVRPPQDWIAGMCGPLLSGSADAVAGNVRIAPHLERAWMQPLHREWLAEATFTAEETAPFMIGANMAFHRRVLARVPAFDTELGPGARGFSDETLFELQMKKSGLTVRPAPQITVEHHFEARRLARRYWLNDAQKRAASLAYIEHHWEHCTSGLTLPYLLRQWGKALIALNRMRRTHPEEWQRAEGAPPWELDLLFQMHHPRHLVKLRKAAPCYEPYGRIKRT